MFSSLRLELCVSLGYRNGLADENHEVILSLVMTTTVPCLDVQIRIGLVCICHRSHHFATLSSYFVNRAGWQANMAFIAFWRPWRNAHSAQYILTCVGLPWFPRNTIPPSFTHAIGITMAFAKRWTMVPTWTPSIRRVLAAWWTANIRERERGERERERERERETERQTDRQRDRERQRERGRERESNEMSKSLSLTHWNIPGRTKTCDLRRIWTSEIRRHLSEENQRNSKWIGDKKKLPSRLWEQG